MTEVERDGGNELILKAIRHAAVCGGLEYWSREDPKSASGLTRSAQHHRALYTKALDEMIEGAVRG